MNWLSLFLGLIWSAVISANASAVERSPARDLLDAREYTAAEEAALAAIADLDDGDPLYDRALVSPLTDLGDARMSLGDLAGAIEAYDRARHLLRVNEGFATNQEVDILLREADAFEQLGDYETANDRHEAAFNTRVKLGTDDVSIATAYVGLAEWYRENLHLTLASTMYTEALDLLTPDDPVHQAMRAKILVELGRVHQERYWPEPGQTRNAFHPRPEGRLWIDYFAGDNIVESRRRYRFKSVVAFKRAVRTYEKLDDTPTRDVIEAKLAYADILNLYREVGASRDRYRDAYLFLEENEPSLIDEYFAEPAIIFQPHPGSPNRYGAYGDEDRRGRIEFSVTVTRKGYVRKIKTVDVQAPPETFLYKYRKAARGGRYRPAYVDGRPVDTEGVKVVFNFPY